MSQEGIFSERCVQFSTLTNCIRNSILRDSFGCCSSTRRIMWTPYPIWPHPGLICPSNSCWTLISGHGNRFHVMIYFLAKSQPNTAQLIVLVRVYVRTTLHPNFCQKYFGRLLSSGICTYQRSYGNAHQRTR